MFVMYVEVLVEIKSKHVDKTFIYQVPSFLEQESLLGKRVLVPFGRQTLEGYVLRFCKKPEIETKELIELIDSEPILTPELMELGQFLKEDTLSSLTSCYAAMLPKALKANHKVKLKKKMIQTYRLTLDIHDAFRECQNESQKKLVELFQEKIKITKKEAQAISLSGLKTLVKKGILKEEEEEVYRYQRKEQALIEKLKLNEEQQKAYDTVLASFDESQVFLLHGVTGSGKTEVYLEIIEKVIQVGKTALVLVPEISLTPQLLERFSKRFLRIAVLHSGLNDGERYDEWRKILRGEVDIVIGARSAIFAPLKDIGVIIMDEEHSQSYKQENTPRYHALDVAKKRIEYHHCPLILGSATPSLESMARALKKVYQYIPLTQRANQSALPEVKIVDMGVEAKYRHAILSRELEYKIIEKLNKKEQVLLLLNRRGYSTTITCSNCGFTYRCPYCDITLTYHKSKNQLRCHYCGYTKYREEVCPNCHEDGLNYYGLGTEKLEDYLSEVFPTARVVRMDRDSTVKKGSYEKIIQDFQNYQYDILLGTQMISKGLDFPRVSLVGILNADQTLNIPDYRSNENAFSLLCQASGRAGRKDTTGEVILQTFYPQNYVLQCVKEQNYERFFQYEMNIRKTLKYPPFYYLVHLTIKSKDYSLATEESKKAKEFLKNKLDSQTILLGPATANLFFVGGVYHYEILIKYRFDSHLKEALKSLDELFLMQKHVSLEIDFH